MKLIIICCALVIVHSAFGQQKDCVQEKEKLIKCKKDVLISADSKKVQDQSRKTIDKCLGKDTVSKCLTKSDECHAKAEETVTASPLKKQADDNAAKCWTNNNRGPSNGQERGQGQMRLVQQGQGQGMQGQNGMPPLEDQNGMQQMQGQNGMPPMQQGQNGMPPMQQGQNGMPPMQQGQNGMPPPPPDMELHPIECMIPMDPKVSQCMDEEETKLDTNAMNKLDNQIKDCHKALPSECMPQNPMVGMCMGQAYMPVMNLTVTTYRKCMTDAGFKFPTAPQMPNFPGMPQMSG